MKTHPETISSSENTSPNRLLTQFGLSWVQQGCTLLSFIKNSIKTHHIKTHNIMKFTILLKLTAFAMLATSSSVYASEDHAVQHSLRGSTLDEDSTADEELYGGGWGKGWGRYVPSNNDGGSSCCGVPAGGTCPAPYKSPGGNVVVMNGLEFCCLDPHNVVINNGVTPMCGGSTPAPPKPSGGNCCGVSVGGSCPAGYESDSMIGSMNGMELCCRDLQNVVITGSPPKCKGSTRAPPKPNTQGTIPCTQYGGVMKSCPQGFDMNDGDDACTCTPSTPAPPKPKAQGPVPCTRSNSGYNMDCPDGMDMSIEGANSCTCTPRVPQGTIPCTQYGGIMKSCPQGFDMNDGNDACTCTPKTSSECDVVNNAMNRAIGCLNVGDDRSTCEACGCSYVAPARMCVEGGYAAY